MSATIRLVLLAFVLLFVTNTPIWAESSPAPRVWSIEADNHSGVSSSITFTVTFSEPVSGVTIDDFAIAGDAQHVTIVAVNAVAGGEQYTVHITVDGDNRGFAVALFDDDSITNNAHIPLGGIGNQNGNTIGNMVKPVRVVAKTQNVSVPRGATVSGRSVASPIGTYVSLALTSSGIPVMSYIDEASKQLKLAVCVDTMCTDSRRIAPAPVGIQVRNTALVLTATDVPLISYYDVSTNDLKLLRCDTLSCNAPTIVTIDSTGDVGADVAMILNPAGIAYMAYSDTTNTSMKLATCNNVACTAPTIAVIDTLSLGTSLDMAFSGAGYPTIIYEDTVNHVLKIAICDATGCTANVASEASAKGVTPLGVAFSATGSPRYAFQDNDNEVIYILTCIALPCTTPSLNQVDTSTWEFSRGIFALTAADTPILTYYDRAIQKLKLVTCESLSCATPTYDIIDAATSVGHMLDLKIDADGAPVVAYVNPADGNLKIYRKPQIIDNGQPNSFAKTAPPAGASLASTEVILAWDAVDNADSYAYCVAVDGVICTSWISTGTARTASLTGLLNKTTYHWQVRATNTIGSTIADAGVEHSFTVSLPPGEFAKTSPAQNAVNQKTSVTLSWGASPYATTYEYCIAATAASCKTWKSTGTARSVVVTGLAKNKIFYWNVRARNEISATNASGTAWKFTTAK